ncbi:hypothetical protein [Nocardia bhagyanarayanae]|uniref:DUF8020 domain-containing protein n=1 Tax=Nocardia bhagyanarayanae TaxID=1215925 RepID=A0A543F8F9_9NOCA|nr:hypothetical protein [Nocardia bhagyanarayanae]TQM30125.1 hypothetical protein FB390_1741 [Nocardia bhagyanarayanae]
MIIRKFAVTALLTITATGIAGGVTYAAPTAEETNHSGTESGVAYQISQSEDGRNLTAKLEGGTFALTETALTVRDKSGTVVAAVPLTVTIDGADTVELRPQLSTDGASLTASPIGYWSKTSPKQRNIEAGIGIGAALGVFGGLFLGVAVTLVSMGLLAPIALPVGLIAGVIAGGAIGAGIGASIPASDLPDRWEYTPECWNGYYHTYCW